MITRKKLLRGGFEPIPVNGKIPAIKGWTKIVVDDAQLERWENLGENTGLLTRRMPTLDADILDPAASEAIESLVQERFKDRGLLLTRIGKEPKRAFPFRTDKPFPKITINLVAPDGDTSQKLEFLGDGQQLVSFGIHPDTRKPYKWRGINGTFPKLEALPLITEDEAQELMEDAADLLCADFGYSHPPESSGDGTAAGWGHLLARIRAGTELHTSIRDLAIKLIMSGMGGGAAVNMLREAMEISEAPRDDRWHERYNDIPRAVATAEEKLNAKVFDRMEEAYKERAKKVEKDEGQTTDDAQASSDEGPNTETPKLAWLDMSDWDTKPIPERQWAVENLIPLKQAGLLSGEGGTGKSIIELTKNVAHVTGQDWFGSSAIQGPAFYIGAEDEADEIHRRLASIAGHCGLSFSDLTKGGLHVLCKLGEDATLCAVSKSTGKVETTDFYRQLYEAAGDIKPKNISIDTLSRAFAGSEIDRVQVYAFVMHMQALASVAGGSVTVLGHPSLSGMASGSGISGSTAWHGAFRWRQYLTSRKLQDGEQPDNDTRELRCMKNQYGRLGEPIALRYQNGLFVADGAVTDIDRAARNDRVDEIFMCGLGQLIRQGRHAIYGTKSAEHGPTLIAALPEAKAERVNKKELEDAMTRLFVAGKIHLGTTPGPPSKAKRCILPRRA
jgi:RecA-family ATPase